MSQPPSPAHRGRLRLCLRAVALTALAVTLATAGTPAAGQDPPAVAPVPSEVPDDISVANGRVWALRQVGDHIYIGGTFTRIGPNTGHGVVLDGDTGTLQAGSPHVDGVVLAVEPDGNGGWYIGGQFSSVNGVGRSNVAHVLADGSVAPWNPFTDRPVRAIAVVDDRVVLGGDFTSVRGTPRQRLAAVRADTGAVVQSWAADVNARVYDIAHSPAEDEVIIAGDFTTVAGVLRPHAAAVDVATGALDFAFAPNPDASVRAVDLSPDGELVYLGGHFTRLGLLFRNRIAAVDARSGFVDPSFAASANGNVHAVRAHPDGARVYVGGAFTTLNGVPRNHLGAFGTTGAVLSWAPFATGSVETISLTPDGTDAVVGGFLGSIDRTPAAFAGKVSLDGFGADPDFDVQADRVVWASAWQGDEVFLGGGFTSVGSVRQPFLARLHTGTGTLDTTWRPTLDNAVITMDAADDGSRLYVGGRFTRVGGQDRGRAAGFVLPTGSLSSWDPAANDQVEVVDAAVGGVFVGGHFTALGDSALHRYVAKTDPTTGKPDPLWQPLPNRAVHAIEVDPTGSPVYLGGQFRFLGLVPREHVAAVSDTGALLPFNPGSPSLVLSLARSGNGQILFGAIGGTPNQGGNAVTAWNTAGQGSVRWKHQGTGDVQTVEYSDATLYVGGHFRRIRADRQLRTGIAAFDAPTGALKAFAPLLAWNGLGVWDIEATESGLLVGGDHTRVGNRATSGLSRFPWES